MWREWRWVCLTVSESSELTNVRQCRHEDITQMMMYWPVSVSSAWPIHRTEDSRLWWTLNCETTWFTDSRTIVPFHQRKFRPVTLHTSMIIIQRFLSLLWVILITGIISVLLFSNGILLEEHHWDSAGRKHTKHIHKGSFLHNLFLHQFSLLLHFKSHKWKIFCSYLRLFCSAIFV